MAHIACRYTHVEITTATNSIAEQELGFHYHHTEVTVGLLSQYHDNLIINNILLLFPGIDSCPTSIAIMKRVGYDWQGRLFNEKLLVAITSAR